jgi:multidrug efflux pump subunit AcrB
LDNTEDSVAPKGFIIGMVKLFLTGPLSLLFIISAIFLGFMAISLTPREEEPQIVVPMVDLMIDFPGHSPEEVEQMVTIPLERLLWQVDGVEHVYSNSSRDSAMVIVRFHVGEDYTKSIGKIRDKIDENMHLIHPDVAAWQMNPIEIDDVPILTMTLFSPRRDAFELRRLAEEMKSRLDSLENIFQTEIIGGYPREILIEPDMEKMAARNLTISDISSALVRNNRALSSGFAIVSGKSLRLMASSSLKTVEDVRNTVVRAGSDGEIVRVEDLASVSDGPREQEYYTEIGFGPASDIQDNIKNKKFPAVTLTFSKKKGTNSVEVAKNIEMSAKEFARQIFPSDVQMITTRNYGETADEKVNDLLSSLAFAMITVVGLISFTMGWREGLIVGLAVPVSFALSLTTNYVFGFSINRVTLFALILSLGMVVDDPITNVDNIQRHIRMGILDPFNATLRAVHEVLPPVILSTIAIIISFIPMFFITGMMGPYMGPMAINVPLTVSFSTLCALTFVPYLAYMLLKRKFETPDASDLSKDPVPQWIRKFYAFAISPFLKKRNAFILLLGTLVLAFLSSLLMFKIPLKMLPFDNKNEIQIILEMPEGTSLESTHSVATDLGKAIASFNEVKNYVTYVGLNAPIDFNGLVRHYGLRRLPHQADIRLNLADKKKRKQQSHAIALRIRDELTEIAEKHGGIVSIIEVPPGPPVLSTLTVEIRGEPDHSYEQIIEGGRELQAILRETDPKHITQIDSYAEAPHDRIVFLVDKDKAAMHGLAVDEISRVLRASLEGCTASGVLHDAKERNPLIMRIRLPFNIRSSLDKLVKLWIKNPSGTGSLVQISELGEFVKEKEEQPIYHKNLERVVYVTAETVGCPPGEVIMRILWKSWSGDFVSKFFYAALSGKWRQKLSNGTNAEWNGEGEWEITTRVFRDLGLAFAVAMLGIFILLVAQTKNIIMPLIIMTAIPLTIIGIAPGFYLLNFLTGKTVCAYSDPVFFTATGMIGMIALGGIVIRNSIVLIEFIEGALKEGKTLQSAILDSGAVRFRPIMLTAVTTMLGSWPITLDPIFSGLAWALIFGLLASTFFTMLIVPVVYMLVYSKKCETEKHNGEISNAK